MTTTNTYRPRAATEIIDGAIQIVRRSYVPMVTVVAIAYVPFLVLQMTVFRGLMHSVLTGQILQLSIATSVGYYVMQLVWFALIDTAMMVAASDAYLGRPVDIAAAFRRAAPRLGATVIASLIKYVLVGLGFVVFFFPALAFVALYFAVPATIVLEGVGPIAGLRRSALLSKGLQWHALGTLVMIYGLYFVVIIGAAILVSLFADQTVIQLFSAIATILVYPFVPTVQALLYYDARIRKEGFDIELLAQRVGVSPVPQSA